MRYTFKIPNEDTWYCLQREARAMFGNQWRTQPKTRKRFRSWDYRGIGHVGLVPVWFEVPDPKWVSVMVLKYGLELEE